jgi:HPt (histidine-containing phosphotransfer) domain-containing protein
VLALTADAFQESVEQSLACGFTMHLAKPIRKATLLAAIGRHTQARSADETGARKIELFVDRELAAIVPKYLDNLRRQVSLMTASLAAQDFHAIFLLGHNMKGTGSMVGIPRISKIGEQLEAAARAQDTGAIKRLTDELVRLLESMNIQYK